MRFLSLANRLCQFMGNVQVELYIFFLKTSFRSPTTIVTITSLNVSLKKLKNVCRDPKIALSGLNWTAKLLFEITKSIYFL